MKLRLLIAAAALAMTALVHAQTLQVQTGTSPVIEVQRLAPQLVAFAGGEVNFANLVNGLALGLPVTLTTPVGAGVTQVVNFTPVGTMSAVQIAQTLETARQSLISRGIATPTAQQAGTAGTGAHGALWRDALANRWAACCISTAACGAKAPQPPPRAFSRRTARPPSCAPATTAGRWRAPSASRS